jgi:hypothetical protein
MGVVRLPQAPGRREPPPQTALRRDESGTPGDQGGVRKVVTHGPACSGPLRLWAGAEPALQACALLEPGHGWLRHQGRVRGETQPPIL